MKPVFAILLSFLLLAGSLFPQTDVEEIYKIPQLLTHYHEHQKSAGPDFSFIDFLILHYSLSSDHAQTPHSEANLPMYSHLCTGLAFVLPNQPCLLFIYALPLSPQYSSHYQKEYSCLFSFSILQPPQFRS